jgi:hypothetical protein
VLAVFGLWSSHKNQVILTKNLPAIASGDFLYPNALSTATFLDGEQSFTYTIDIRVSKKNSRQNYEQTKFRKNFPARIGDFE